MAWLAVDDDGSEYIYEERPCRIPSNEAWAAYIHIPLPNGSINKLIGRTLTWEDEPVEI